MKKIELASDAQSDLLEIWVYLGEKSVRLADRIALQIEQKIDTLSLFPAMGRSRDELQKGLRSLVVGDYLIFYQNQEEKITVLRVLHGSRDFTELFSLNEDNDENG